MYVLKFLKKKIIKIILNENNKREKNINCKFIHKEGRKIYIVKKRLLNVEEYLTHVPRLERNQI